MEPRCRAGDATNWAEQYNATAEDWMNEYGQEGSGAEWTAHQPRTRQQGYMFAPDNPFLDDTDSFAKVRSATIHQLTCINLC